MHIRTFRRTVLSLSLATALVATIVTPAQARPEQGPPTGAASPAASPVYVLTERLAVEIARALAEPANRKRIVSAATQQPADLGTLERGSRLAGSIAAANQAVLTAKGLPATAGSVLRLRLAHPDMRAALARGAVPLVAAAPTDDTAAAMVGYDHRGGQVLLDVTRLPSQPVLLVEVDVAKVLPIGLALIRQELAARDITDVRSQATTAAAGYWATKVNAVRLNDDKEPWHKGGAEIFNLVAGFGLDGKAKVDLVQMPYLDHDGTTYYPNQLLVHFSAYKYNLADVVMMEDDGDTNYQQLVTSIVNALLAIVDIGVYAPLVSAILSAIPASWWSDDPDYVDSWYTLSTGSSGRLNGAAGNGWLDVSPYFVQEL